MKKYVPVLLLLGCAAALVFGVMQLFALRFEVGDVYPAYSSLRSDPLGTMAFYESLGRLPGLVVRRDFSAQDRLPEEPHTVYLHLAASRYDWTWIPKDSFREIERFLVGGGRLVITMFPQTESYQFHYPDGDGTNTMKSGRPPMREEKEMSDKPAEKKKNKKKEKEETDWGVQMEERWGFHADFLKLAKTNDVYAPVAVTNRAGLPIPERVDWHSGTVFTRLDEAWRVIYARGTNAVLIERRFGRGSVVLATDSYFVSNEAMVRDRHADLLAWLIGPNSQVVFDEAHLGVVETSGVAVLMRQYRLHGLAAGLLLLAGLFIWKNSVSLVPPHPDEKRQTCVAGKDAASGFINLLRRSIAPRDLLSVCFAEWKKTPLATARHAGGRVQQAEMVLAAETSRPLKGRDLVAAYKKTCSALDPGVPPSKL